MVLELGFKRCFQLLFSIPNWPSLVMRNVDFNFDRKGGEKKTREWVTPRERERRRKMGTLRCLCDIKIRV